MRAAAVLSLILMLCGCLPELQLSAGRPSVTATGSQLAVESARPFFDDGRWSLAGESQAARWLAYAAPDAISAVAVDGDTLWVASNGGLLRWQRSSHTLVQYLAPQVPLPDNNVRSLLLAGDKLYVATFAGLAVLDRAGRWTRYDNAEIGIADAYLRPLAMVAGVLWLGTDNRIAHLHADGHWEVQSLPSGLLPAYPIQRIVAQGTAVYLEVGSGLSISGTSAAARWLDGSWTAGDTMPADLSGPEGVRWRARGEAVFEQSTDSGMSWQDVAVPAGSRGLAVDSAGRLLAAQGSALHVIERSGFVETYAYAAAAPDFGRLSAMAGDERGRIWLANEQGALVTFDGRRWVGVQPPVADGPAAGQPLPLAELAALRGGVAGLSRPAQGDPIVLAYDLARQQWSNLTPPGTATGLAAAPGGHLVALTRAGQLQVYDGNAWRASGGTVPAAVAVEYGQVVVDPQGTTWLAGDDAALYAYDGQAWRREPWPAELGRQSGPYRLAAGREGQLWVAGAAAAAMRDPQGRWHVARLPPAAAGAGLAFGAIAADAKGRLWGVRPDILATFDGMTWQVIEPREIGAARWGQALAFDAQGRLWVGVASQRGVAVLNSGGQVLAH